MEPAIILFIASLAGAVLFFFTGFFANNVLRKSSTQELRENPSNVVHLRQPNAAPPALERPKETIKNAQHQKVYERKRRSLDRLFGDLVHKKSCQAAILSDRKGLVIMGQGAHDTEGLAATVGMLQAQSDSMLAPVWMSKPEKIDLKSSKRGWLSSRSFKWGDQTLYASVLGAPDALDSEDEAELIQAARDYLDKIGTSTGRETNHG